MARQKPISMAERKEGFENKCAVKVPGKKVDEKKEGQWISYFKLSPE